MEEIILSIKPRFSSEIYSGKKILELRKRIGCKFKEKSKIYIYSSSPVRKISGYAYIRKIQTLPVQKIKLEHLKEACIEEDAFDKYYQGYESGVLIWLHRVVKYEVGISLAVLKERGFTAPQSFCYVSENIQLLLEEAL